MSAVLNLLKNRRLSPYRVEIEKITSETTVFTPEELRSKLSSEFEILGAYSGLDYINARTANNKVFDVMKDYVVYFVVTPKDGTGSNESPEKFEFNFQPSGYFSTSTNDYSQPNFSKFIKTAAKVAFLLGLSIHDPQGDSDEALEPKAFALKQGVHI